MAICLYLIVQLQVTTVDTCTSYILNHGTVVILFNRIDWIYSIIMFHFMYILHVGCQPAVPHNWTHPGFATGFVMSHESRVMSIKWWANVFSQNWLGGFSSFSRYLLLLSALVAPTTYGRSLSSLAAQWHVRRWNIEMGLVSMKMEMIPRCG